MKVHIGHPAFAHHTACGREVGDLKVTFGGQVVTCRTCRAVMLRILGVAS